uniref:Glycosyl transferase CAP10 domain-containing protein n=2 Tax=Anopheles albimanus TaxID=7167 RepID=A0A182F622_ANOAL
FLQLGPRTSRSRSNRLGSKSVLNRFVFSRGFCGIERNRYTEMQQQMVLLLATVLLVLLSDIVTVTTATSGSSNNANRVPLDPQNTRVWGPGVEIPDRATLPARYFFIEPRDANNLKINESQKYDVHIIGQSRFGSCRYRLNQIDRHDGSSILRYRLAESCTDVTIHVRHNGAHLNGSPFAITGPLYSEQCYCPQGSADEWLESVGCPPGDPQIDMDLIPFRAINFSSLRTRMIQQYDKPGSISHCNYVILRNDVHRRCYGQHTGFSKFMDTILLSLARKFSLPDMELFVNLGDWPLVKKGGPSRTTGPYPIFSWCGSDDTFDIVMPTYDITESTLENMGRVMLDMLSIQRRGVPWPDKHRKAFWRGRDARRERLELVRLARRHPELLNASLTNFFFFRDEESEFGPRVAHISMHDFFDYRYQVNVDGTVAAYRLPYLLAGSSVVMKQDSFYYEHFYRKLVPMRHYIPFEADLSNLLQQVEWARENDEKAQEIRDNANAFVNANLLPLDIYCYHALLFKEYARYIVSPIQVQPGMEKIEQPEEAYHCPCERTTLPRDEL